MCRGRGVCGARGATAWSHGEAPRAAVMGALSARTPPAFVRTGPRRRTCLPRLLLSAELGLLPALNALAEGIERRHDVRVDLTVESVIEEDVKVPAFTEDVYQIISEAVHNAVKHAAPAVVRVDVRIDRGRRLVRIDVVDDGRGVDHVRHRRAQRFRPGLHARPGRRTGRSRRGTAAPRSGPSCRYRSAAAASAVTWPAASCRRVPRLAPLAR
ncbi:ATP-binding protein [Streptomyces sp. NPDC002920]